MSAKFVSASSQRLVNSGSPVAAVPLSVGFWLNITTGGVVQTPWANADTATATNFFRLVIDAANAPLIGTRNAANISVTVGLSAITVGAWHYFLGRWITTSSRRLSVLYPNGVIEHSTETTAVTPSSVDTIALGGQETSVPTQFTDSKIAEYWMTNTDIQSDGAQTNNEFLRTLAYGGPFQFPHIVSNLVEYRSLRVKGESAGDQMNEVYSGKFGRQTWTNTNGATMGDHPPLPSTYIGPADRIAAMIV